ncbi:hypothetical protein D3C84_810800 [compost metagenome]
MPLEHPLAAGVIKLQRGLVAARQFQVDLATGVDLAGLEVHIDRAALHIGNLAGHLPRLDMCAATPLAGLVLDLAFGFIDPGQVDEKDPGQHQAVLVGTDLDFARGDFLRGAELERHTADRLQLGRQVDGQGGLGDFHPGKRWLQLVLVQRRLEPEILG